MTDAQWEALGGYIRTVADSLGLRDWQFSVKREPCDDDSQAEILCTYGRKHAEVRVGADWMDCEPTRQRLVVVHELLHCHLDPIGKLAHNDLPQVLGQPASALLAEVVQRDIEFAVDGIAEAVAGFFPEPVMPGG